MSNATQGGPSFWGRRPDLWYFDRLPPTARAALANAAFDWASGWIYGRWRRGTPGYQTGPDISQRIAEADARQITRDRKRVWKLDD
jgi:Family of unknown function (DUF6525)